MPLYEYDCQGCGKQVEILVRGSEKVTCPECGSPKLAKRLSVVSVATGSSGSPAPSSMPPSCGTGCGCHPRK